MNDVIICSVCHNNVVYSFTAQAGQPLEAFCSFCQSMINAGMIKPETVDGVLRYRQWHQTWTPGELIE